MKHADFSLERDLQGRLLQLSFHALLHAVAELLTRMSYQDVELAGRTAWMGRHPKGGCDLVAFLPVPGGKRRVIVQVKQYPAERKVFRRAIDELRGVCLRSGASEAVLITTSTFTDMVDARRLAAALVAPVRLINGRELADLLTLHQVGTWVEPPGSPDQPARCGLDERYFADLEKRYPQTSPRTSPSQLAFEFSVTLQRLPLPKSLSTKKAALPRRS